ncbi:hypothetical protein AbraIFM66950_011940 [Aspergillus brasiliensis]|nr:hypothetical protein AbraIFM66950_011940 [Aspergillus brasiliensis]
MAHLSTRNSTSALLAQSGLLSVSGLVMEDALAHFGINIERMRIPSAIYRLLPAEAIYALLACRYEAYKAVVNLESCYNWYKKRFEYLCPREHSGLRRHIRSVKLILGGDFDNRRTPTPAVAAGRRIARSRVTLQANRQSYENYARPYNEVVRDFHQGLFAAQFFIYEEVAYKAIQRANLHLHSRVTSWLRSGFSREMAKWLAASNEVPFVPSYADTVEELVTAIEKNVEGGVETAQEFGLRANFPYC